MISFRSRLRASVREGGFTLIEMLIAGVLIGGTVLFFTRSFKATVQAQRAALDETAITQIEKSVVTWVMWDLHFYMLLLSTQLTGACNISSATPYFSPPSGFLYWNPRVTAGGVFLWPAPPWTFPGGTTGLRALPGFSAAMTRCQLNQDVYQPSTDISGKRGIYFCLWLSDSPFPSARSDTHDRSSVLFTPTLGPAPVFIEFRYVPQTTTGIRITCNEMQYLPQDEVLGTLYYTFYWAATGPSGNTSMTRSGVRQVADRTQ